MIVIRHDHEGGTRLEGSRKGDGAFEILRPRGWTFRAWAGVHIRGSRDTFASPSELERHTEALRAAGHHVTVEVDNTWRPAAVRWAEREERAEDRADRLDDRAGRAAARSTAARDARRQISDRIPFGQPKLVGHHSYARACRDERRMETLDGRSYGEADHAEHLAARAAGARRNEDAKHNPRAIMRKIEQLQTHIRQAERGLTGHERRFHDGNGNVVRVETQPPATGEWADIARLRIARDREEIDFLRAMLAQHADSGTFVAWSRDNVARGDLVRVESFGWFRVTRVNVKSVSLDTTSWPRTAQWDQITGRRRDGQQIDAPNGEPWPVELAERVARWKRLVHETTVPADDEGRRWHRYVEWAPRMVHGLDLAAADAELAAIHTAPLAVAERRDLASRYLEVYDRLRAGERYLDIVASLAVDRGTSAWRIPVDREPEDHRAGPSGWRNDTQPLVQPGDLIKGVWQNGGLGGRDLFRGFCGPVASVSAVRDRREAGQFVTVRLVDGAEREFQTHVWLAVYPAGTWETRPTSGGPEDRSAS